MFDQCEDLEILVDRNSTANMLNNIDLEKIHVVEINEEDEVYKFEF